MHRNSKADLVKKAEARKRYAERQIDKWISWSIKNRGKVPYKELMEVIDMYNNK